MKVMRDGGVNFEQSTLDLTAASAVYLGRRRCGLTLRQLAKAIDGASAGAVSVAARRFRRRLETDRRLRALAEEAESYLSNVQS